jgi:hypothetical protein
MQDTEETRIALAASVGEADMGPLLHDPSPRVMRALLGSCNMTEENVLIIANRRNLPADVLESIARDKRWAESYAVRLALARNPRSPLSVSLSVARFLRMFDLEELTRSHFIPAVFRHKVESMIVERIPAMPLGNKKTLARKAAGAVLLKLLQDRSAEVLQLCLNNPRLIEAHLFKIISREDTGPETIRMIAEHPNWSTRPLIRFSLARNANTPLALSVRFLEQMRIMDLRDLYADPLLPVTIKPFVHRELVERGVDPGAGYEETIFEIDEEEVAAVEADELMPRFTEGDADESSEERKGQHEG